VPRLYLNRIQIYLNHIDRTKEVISNIVNLDLLVYTRTCSMPRGPSPSHHGEVTFATLTQLSQTKQCIQGHWMHYSGSDAGMFSIKINIAAFNTLSNKSCKLLTNFVMSVSLSACNNSAPT
jgi:hypothetical protein